jgi:hypothetical protein
MIFPQAGGSTKLNSLSPVDADGWAGDGTSMLFRVPKFRVRKANGPQARGKLMPNQFGVTVYHCSVARNDKAQPVC